MLCAAQYFLRSNSPRNIGFAFNGLFKSNSDSGPHRARRISKSLGRRLSFLKMMLGCLCDGRYQTQTNLRSNSHFSKLTKEESTLRTHADTSQLNSFVVHVHQPPPHHFNLFSEPRIIILSLNEAEFNRSRCELAKLGLLYYLVVHFKFFIQVLNARK